MVRHGSDPISHLMIGDMGIKRAALGDKEIYARIGSYVYITLNTKTDNKIDKEKEQ